MAVDVFNFVKDTLNRPSFPQLMGQLGPLRLALPHLPWSQLNDDARRALSTHAFCSIRLGESDFLSVGDLCEFLHSSPELETLALEHLSIKDTSIPTLPQHRRRVPSVLRLRLNDYNPQSRILKVIVDACLVSFDRLRDLDVTISSAEELALLQNILDTSSSLETLKVSHASYNSHKGQLPCSHLSLKRLHRLDLMLDDTNDAMSTIVQADLFEWWCAVWADSKFTSVEELSITTRLMSPPDGNYDVTVWPKIGAALSCPAWARLSALSIVIFTWAGCDAECDIHLYKEVIQQAMNSCSVNISIVLQHLEDDDDLDYAIHSEEWQEDVNVGYRDW
ncbi:hypothetical protein F5146DRAFT_1138598 [Armillaria mellea]|nr:hypothetical protein F5146DRAFT_1138598 [Armillaria mellea]